MDTKTISNKVVPIRKNNVIESLESLLELAKDGEITGFVAAGFLKDQSVFTAINDVDIIEQHTLNSYLQVNAIRRSVSSE